MQESKERLYVINDVLGNRTGITGPLAHEFCLLQLRMICECIAFACVIAHAYIDDVQKPRFQRGWSAADLAKELDRLHPDFYPQPKLLSKHDGGIHLTDIEAPYLRKAELKTLYGLCGDRLHRGSPEKYTYNPTPQLLSTQTPGGHLELPQLWPGQTPPPGRGGTRDDYAAWAFLASRAADSRSRQLLPSHFSR
jgi:hypothetical protein